MDRKVLTMRFILDRNVLLDLLEEQGFAENLSLRAKCHADPPYDQFLAIFVFEAVPQEGGALRMSAISTTVLGFQRYTTKRLTFQGVYSMSEADWDGILADTLRAHFRAQGQDLAARLRSLNGPQLPWTKQFANGAGDLNPVFEVLIEDPEVAELNALFHLEGEEQAPEGQSPTDRK